MNRLFVGLNLAWIPFILAFASPNPVTMTNPLQTGIGSLASFTLQASPNPINLGQSTTLTATATGANGTPTGTVDFYVSSTTDGCSLSSDIGTTTGSGGVYTENFSPSQAGATPICAVYIPSDGDVYAAATAGDYLLQVNGVAPFSVFDIGASPNPMPAQAYSTLSAYLVGSYGSPTGQVEFYVSSNSTTCTGYSNSYDEFGGTSVSSFGVASLNAYLYYSGTYSICADYIPGTSDAYAAASSGPFLLTVYQPTIFTVSVPPSVFQGSPIPFTFGLTTPSGQPPPTGTITLYDPNNDYATIGTTNVSNGVISPPTITASLTGNSYEAEYGGDSNYEAQTVYGSVLYQNGLSLISPSAVTVGSPTTNFTLTGAGFNANSVVYLGSGDGRVTLPVNSFTPTQIQTTITANNLLIVGELSITVVTGTITGGPITLQVYAPYTDTAAFSTTSPTDTAAFSTTSPTVIPYGATSTPAFTETVTRGVPTTDAAVPAGPINLTLTGTGAQAGYSAAYGSGPLSQVSTPGTYLSPFIEPLDTNGSAKLISVDLNGDGYADVVGMPGTYYPNLYYQDYAAGAYLQVMLSTGANGLQTEEQVPTGCLAQDFAVGDIVGNGIPDLVVVCNSSGYASSNVNTLLAFYMLGNGDGTFQAPVAFGGNSFIGAPSNVVLGQFNGDGYLDIAVIDGINGQLQVISPIGNPGNPLGPLVGFDTSNGYVQTAGAADFNQDGLSDLALLEFNYPNSYNQYTNGAVLVLNSQGNDNGFYQQSETQFSAETYYMQSMTITDVNGDGYPDVAVADFGQYQSDGGDNGNLLIFENDQQGNLPLTFTYSANNDGALSYASAVVGLPFPTIGQPAQGAAAVQGWNLAYSGIGSDNNFWIQTLQRQSAQNWTAVTSVDTYVALFGNEGGTFPDLLATGDMNGDGYLDFVVDGVTYSCTDCQSSPDLMPFYYSNDAQANVTGNSLPSPPLPGTYTLSMTYPGNQLYQGTPAVTTPITITQGVVTGLVSGPSSDIFGNSDTFTVTVNGVAGGVAPTGTVLVYSNGVSIGTANLSSNGGSTATGPVSAQLALGNDTITAYYQGDVNYNPGSLTPTTIQINVSAPATNYPLTMFDIGASPAPVGDGLYTTLTATLAGAYGVPTGQVWFYSTYISNTCAPYNYYYGQVSVGSNGVASTNAYANQAGTVGICAQYIPNTNGDPYAGVTAGPYLLTVNQPTIFSVSVGGASLPGTPVPFTFGITSPSGQVAPTGTILLEDSNNGYTIVGTANVVNGSVTPSTVYATLSGSTYYAVYSGDSNYESQAISGDIQYLSPLSSITPAAIPVGSPDTTFTLNGQGFTANTTAYIVTPGGQVSLNIVGQSSTQLQVTIPAGNFQNPGELQVGETTVNGNSPLVGGPVQLQVFAPYTDTGGVSTSNPASVPYGFTISTNFNALISRGVPSVDAAVPVGQVTFSLNGTGAQSGYSASLGTATLSQVSTPGTYLSPMNDVIDYNGNGKLVSADLNGDGFVDVVGLPGFYPGNGASAPFLQVMLSTGDNAFQSEQQVFSGCAAQDFAVGDINGDGIPDLVLVCSTNGTASGTPTNLKAFYMLGNGDGTFQAPVCFGSNSSIGAPTQVVLGQFNYDGYLDIAVIDGVNGNVQVISPFGDSGNPYGPEVGFNIYNGQVVSAGAADFNQDGLTDLVLEEYSSSNGGGGILVLNSQGNYNGFYQQTYPSFSANTYSTLQSMTITDIDGDGYPDVVIADPSTNSGQLLVFQNDTYGDLNQTYTQQINSVFSVAGLPFPTIGQPAQGVAATQGWNLTYTYINPNTDNNDISVGQLQYNASSGLIPVGTSFDTGLQPYQYGDPNNIPNFIVAGDMNGDGYLDFAINGSLYSCSDCQPTYTLHPLYYSNDAQAAITGSNLPSPPLPGTYTLSMTYPGNQLYQPNPLGSNPAASTPITITQATPTGVLLADGAITYGSNTTFYATVSGVNNGASPSGTVTFYDNGNSLGTVNLLSDGVSGATAQLSTSLLAPGLHTITTGYNGDSNYIATNPVASAIVQVSPATITLVLTSSTTSTTAGAMVNFQVQGTGTVLPPSVTLTGLPTAAPVTLALNSFGPTSFSYGLFPPGNYTIQAIYAGNPSYQAATSNSVSLQVSATPVNITLTSSANPVTYPAAIGLTANATTSGLGLPSGTLFFQNNGSQIGSGNLATVNGSSGLNPVPVGTYDTVTGQTVIAIATGDFNKDGNQDLAVLETGSGAASLLISLGKGDGTFQTPTVYSSTSFGFDPTSVAIAAADFNSDGYTDLVVAASDGAVVVLLATGDSAGDFTPGSPIAAGGTPVAVATGNFDGNGQGFVVISTNLVAVYYGNGSGSFSAGDSLNITLASSNLTGVTVADFNHDGYADFAVSDNNGLDAWVFLYNSDGGGFNSPQIYPVGASATAIASGDINGDGYPDLAVVSNIDSTVDVLINNGPGNGGTLNSAGSFYGVASTPTGIAMADFNKDGYADIAVTGASTGQGGGTTILLGSSTGAMVGEASLPSANGQAIATADFNNDTNPDLAVGLTGVAIFLDSAVQAGVSNIALNAGTAPLTAVYNGSDSGQFAASTSPTVNEVVNQAQATIAWNPPGITYGTALSSAQLDATSSVPGTFNYSPAAGTVLTAGPQTLTVTFVPNDTTDYLGTTASVTINVSQAASTLSWSSPAAITFGTPLSATQLNATASVLGTFAYTPAAGTVLGVGTQLLTVTFVPADSIDYKEASATVSITVKQAPSTVTWANPAAITYGTALSNLQLDASASVPGTYTYSPDAGTVLSAGPHQLTVNFVPNDGVDYAATSATASITVNQASSTVTWSNPAAITYGTALSSAQLNATASVPGTFAYSPATGTVIGAGLKTLNVTFTPNDATDYASATGTVQIQVNKATPAITWNPPAAITYGTALGASQLNASASTGGTMVYTPAAGTLLGAGLQTLNVSFTPTDAVDYNSASGSVSIQVSQATPVISWSAPGSIPYGTPLNATQLNATATPPGGAFVYNPPAGAILPQGTQTLSVTYTPTDTTDYASATSTVSIQVTANLALASIQPSSANYGSSATTITLTGTGFAANSIVQLNGTTIPSSYFSPDQMTAQIPASFFQQTQAGAITVTNPGTELTTPPVAFTVSLPSIQVTFSGPGSEGPGQQPTLNLQFLAGYPLPLQVTLTLAVAPATSGGPVDPAVQFSTGGDTLSFALPANSTTVPAIQLQTGTLPGTITVTLKLESGGQDVTPTGLEPVIITVPTSAPVITSVTLAESGNTLTVTVQGYSSSQNMDNAIFTFTPVAGATIDTKQLTVDVSTDFSGWYTLPNLNQYGSAFTYTQVFTTSTPASSVASVSVQLTNSVGTSNTVSAN